MLSIDREAGPATAIAAIPAALALAARRPGLATVLAAVAAGSAVAFTAGCSTSGGDDGGVVTLEFWSFYQGSEADFVDSWVKDYNASHDDVQINHTVVSAFLKG